MRMATTWAQSAAATLLARRSTQVTWMRTAPFIDYLTDYLSRHDAGQFITGEPAIKDLSRSLTDHWTSGERYVVSKPAAAALFSAASTLEDEVLTPLHPDDLPADVGMVVLPRTIYGTSMRGERVGVSAFSWGPCYAAPGVPGVFLVTWTQKDAEDDDRLRAMRTARSSMRRLADQTMEEVREFTRALNNDHETPEEEKAVLRELIARRKHDAQVAQRNANRPEQGGEFSVLDMQPIPFMHEFRVKKGSERGLHDEKTTPLDAVDPDSSTLVTRLPFAFWTLVQQGLLPLSPVPLTPKVERKYAKRSMPHAVQAVGTPEGLWDDDLITATKVRVVRDEDGPVRDGFQWDLATPIGGRVR